MRILSDFHDYYDGVQRYGQDDGLLYVRRTTQFNSDEEKSLYVVKSRSPFDKNHVAEPGVLGGTGHVLAFCGKWIPVLELKYTPRFDPTITVFCYSVTQVQEAILHLNPRKIAYNKLHTWPRATYTMPKDHGLRLRSFFDLKATDAPRPPDETHEALDAPVFVWHEQGLLNPKRLQSPIHVESNPRLQDLDFARAADPYTAYQELALWLGALAVPDRPIVKIGDQVMRDEKGFDRLSFRKQSKSSGTPREPHY